MQKGLDRAWVEVDLDSIVHNFIEVRRIVNNKTLIMPVVKANAYGHGALEISKVLVENGADRLAIATIDEAIQLRDGSINIPLQVLGYTLPNRANDIVRYDLIQTVYDMELANSISRAAITSSKRVKVHVKINTGMNRVGFACTEESIDCIAKIANLKGLILEGIMTHFACADDRNKAYTIMQFDRFCNFYKRLEENGVRIPIRHVSNSAAVLNDCGMNLEMVRPGIVIYGLHPSKESTGRILNLMPAMKLKARIISIKNIEENEYLSYGCTYRCKRKSRIATLSIGYADGYPRNLSNRVNVVIHGQYAPIVGRICMDQCMADITDIRSSVKVGDEAVFMGSSGKSEISADEIACLLDTINYEVVSRMGARLPRIYVRNNGLGKSDDGTFM